MLSPITRELCFGRKIAFISGETKFRKIAEGRFMTEWHKVIQDEVRREHRDKVLESSLTFLKENAAKSKEEWGKRGFLKFLFGGLATAAAAWVVIIRPSIRQKLNSENGVVSSDFLAMAPVLGVDLDLLSNLEMIEDLEVLEKWEPT